MKKKKLIVYGCPYCKEYLAKSNNYKCCMYCGKSYDKNKLIVLDVIKYEEY